MIRTTIWLGWVNLKRDRVALGLTFVLPLIFFSIFAVVLGGAGQRRGGGSSGPRKIHLTVIDQDNSKASQALIRSLQGQEQLDVTTAPSDSAGDPIEAARQQVRAGKFGAAIVVPQDFGKHFPDFAGQGPSLKLFYDSANPMVQPTISGLLQAAAFTGMPELMMDRAFDLMEPLGWLWTDKQKSILDGLKKALRGEQSWEDFSTSKKKKDSGKDGQPKKGSKAAKKSSANSARMSGFIRVDSTAARAQRQSSGPSSNQVVTYYAAGIGVMFLLFSMTGASSSLLEEEETGTLERVLTCSGSIGGLLLGRWLFYSTLGAIQVALMFVWGALVFDIKLWTVNHLTGCLLMTITTAAAASAFGIVMATLCRTRAQLNGVSTIVVLIMSALGGSMMPRFIMPKFMETTSKFTFNGWAIDGYLKVFWYDNPNHNVVQATGAVLPYLIVLMVLTGVFLGIARVMARRWEAV